MRKDWIMKKSIIKNQPFKSTVRLIFFIASYRMIINGR